MLTLYSLYSICRCIIITNLYVHICKSLLLSLCDTLSHNVVQKTSFKMQDSASGVIENLITGFTFLKEALCMCLKLVWI